MPNKIKRIYLHLRRSCLVVNNNNTGYLIRQCPIRSFIPFFFIKKEEKSKLKKDWLCNFTNLMIEKGYNIKGLHI